MKGLQKNSYYVLAFERLKDHKLAMAGLVFCVFLVLAVVILPFVLDLDPYSIDQEAFGSAPGVGGHLLGTDTIGRDVFARLIFGGRVSLFVGVFSTLVSILIGVPIGLLAGYVRGKIETVIMRLTDIFMSFPAIILILVAVAIIGPSIWSVSVIIGVLNWTQFTRIVYSKVLTVSQEKYVEAAHACDVRTPVIIWKYACQTP